MGDCRHDQVHQTLDPYEVRVRTKCQTKILVKVNESLTQSHKARLDSSPFKWTQHLPEISEVSNILLDTLARRWALASGGFRVRSKVVHFSPLHVCFATGLPIVGEKVLLANEVESRTKSLVTERQITLANIEEHLLFYHSAGDDENFIRLYLYLAFVEFYFPNTNGTVNDGLLLYLDDLESLHKFNWGVAVYDSLVGSVDRASKVITKRKNSYQTHITGCAAILQLWALEHVSLWSIHKGTTKSFPRIIHWENIELRSKVLENAFRKNSVVEEIAVTTEEIEQHDVLREALDEAANGFQHWANEACTQPEHKRLDDMINALSVRVAVLQIGATKNHLQSPTSSRQAVNDSSGAEVDSNDRAGADEGDFNGNSRVDEMEIDCSACADDRDLNGHSRADEVEIDDSACAEVCMDAGACCKENVEAPPRPVCPRVHPATSNVHHLNRLYDFCTIGEIGTDGKDPIIKINSHIVERDDLRSMRLHGLVSNMVFLVAAKFFMEEEKCRVGYVRRYMLPFFVVDKAIKELDACNIKKPPVWNKRTLEHITHYANILSDMRDCNMIFAPAIYNNHWYCYGIDMHQKIFHVLDSLGSSRHKVGPQALLDNIMYVHANEIVRLLDTSIPRSHKWVLDIKQHDLPLQHNEVDCGALVLKYMDIWDGSQLCGMQTMPDYTEEEVDNIRQDFVCRWVLSNANELRTDVLVAANLPEDLTL